MLKCPVCGQRSIGKVGADQYFCWDCCVEFVINGQTTDIYNVEPDGTLSQFNSSQEIGNLQMQKG